MTEYWALMSAGMIGAVGGSLVNSLQKKHDAPTLGIRVVENLVVGWPIDYAVRMFAPVEQGGIMHIALVGGLVYLFHNNAMTKPIEDQADAAGTWLLTSMMQITGNRVA